MRRLPLPRLTARGLLILLGVVGVLVAGSALLFRIGYRMALQTEMSYNASQEQLYADSERRFRKDVDSLRRVKESDAVGGEIADRIFESLRYSRSNNSREVDRWRDEPDSPERRAEALKWGRLAANEDAYHRELHRLWRLGYERNLPPHQITEDEVKPVVMPMEWTGKERRRD